MNATLAAVGTIDVRSHGSSLIWSKSDRGLKVEPEEVVLAVEILLAETQARKLLISVDDRRSSDDVTGYGLVKKVALINVKTFQSGQRWVVPRHDHSQPVERGLLLVVRKQEV